MRMPVAMVPPDMAPFIVAWPWSAAPGPAFRVARRTPRSLGTLSKPQLGTMTAPESAAAAWSRSMIRRTHGTSPSMST